MKNLRHVALLITILFALLLTGIALGQGAGTDEDPFAPKGLKPFDVNIKYDLDKSTVKTIYVAPSSHWDREFTDPDDVEREQLVVHINDLIDTARAHPDFRWQEEAIWHIEAWMRSEPSPERQEALFSMIRSGQITVGATEYMTTGLPNEIVGRQVYKAADFAEKHNLKFETAVAADFIGFNWDQVQPLVRSGVKYLLNSHHITYPPADGLPRKSQPYWWEGPDGSRLMVWRMEYTSAFYPYCVSPGASRFFSTREMGKAAAALGDLQLMEVAIKHQLRKLGEDGYDKDAILIINSHDNIKPSIEVRLFDYFKKWNAAHASPKLVMATPEDFFHHMEQKYGKDLPVFRGEFREAWQGAGYRNVPGRQAACDLVEAEKLASFNDISGANIFPALMDRQTMSDLFETAAHGGGAWWGSDLQTEYTKLRRDQLGVIMPARANYMRCMALSALGQKIYTAKPSFVVVNDLSWNRTGIVEFPVIEKTFPKGSVLKDAATGQVVVAERVPCESTMGINKMPSMMRQRKWYLGEIGTGRIRFLASDVPAMGYKVFNIVQTGADPAKPAEETPKTTTTVDTRFFRMTLSPSGQIKGLFDKTARREMVAPDAKSSFAGVSARIFRGMRNRFNPDIATVEMCDKPGTMSIHRGPVATVIDVERPDDTVTRTQIVISESSPEIRIKHYFNESRMQQFGRSRWHTFMVSLPFNYKASRFQTRIQTDQTIRDESTNQMTPTTKTLTNGVIGWGSYFTDGRHGTFVSSREISDIPFFFNNEIDKGKYATVRLSASPGAALFGQPSSCEFVISTDAGKTDPAEIYRRSLAGVNPLRAVPTRDGELMPWEKESDYLHESAESLVKVDSPDVIVTALKRARGGQPNEYALRLLEIGSRKHVKTNVTLPGKVKAAYLADQTERKGAPLALKAGAVSVEMKRNELLTLRLEF